MLIDSRALPKNVEIEADICIIGAGTAGLTLAREFIGTSLRISMIESGGLLPDRETQSLYRGSNVGLPYYSLEEARARFFGGSSHRWHVDIGYGELGVRLRPLDPIDFEPRDWVPHSGWPFSKAHLDPFYSRAEVICGVGPPTYELAEWHDPTTRPPLPLLPSEMVSVIYKFGSREVFANTYTKEVAAAANVTTYLYANALLLRPVDDRSRVSSVYCETLHGNEFAVKAKIYILALGGLETPRILLLSSLENPGSLGNSHDLIGRFFMEHPHFWSGSYFPSRMRSFADTKLYNAVHVVSGVPVIGKLAVAPELMRKEHLLNQNIQLIPRVTNYRPCSKSANRDHLSVFGKAWGQAQTKARRSLSPKRNYYRLANMSEQVPNPESRVSLDLERDRFGQNRVKLDWRVTNQDILSVKRTQEIFAAAIGRAGLGEVCVELEDSTPPKTIHGGYHHMGTTRMHNDPKAGVVDDNSKVHGVSNLYVGGSSVFPTVGYANPVLTIVALSVRLADHVKKVFGRLPQ